MTSHPPSGPPSGPPAGPPTGPLSGPSTRPGAAGPPPPPTGPPSGGSGGGRGGPGGPGGGDGAGGGPPTGGGSSLSPASGDGGGPWWRSVPKVASVTAILVAVAALAVVLTSRSDDKGDRAGQGGGEVFLQNASATGPDPFTASTARTDGGSAAPASLPPRGESAEAGTPRVSGSAPGLYGGTRSVASCDVEQQIRFLSAEPAKNAAFASVLGVSANEVPGYLRSLTPLQLRVDTRVTNHGYRNGAATTYQAVLQSGTAVMVDGRGVPRVRCACGNPLTEPVAQKSPRTSGTPWQGYDSSQVVVVAPAVTVVNVFVVYDPVNDGWFARRHGDTGQQDKPTPPPPRPTPPVSPSVSVSPSPSTSISASPSAPPLSPVPCVTVKGDETPAPRDGVTPSPCPATSVPSPETSPPSDAPDTSSPPDESSSPETSPETSSETSPETGPETGPTTDRSADRSPDQVPGTSGDPTAGPMGGPASA